MKELIGPETNLYDRPERVAMKSLADARILRQLEVVSEEVLNTMQQGVSQELDYGAHFEGEMFTFNMKEE